MYVIFITSVNYVNESLSTHHQHLPRREIPIRLIVPSLWSRPECPGICFNILTNRVTNRVQQNERKGAGTKIRITIEQLLAGSLNIETRQ